MFNHFRASRVVVAVVVSLAATAGGVPAEEAVRILWRVPRDHVAEVRDELRLEGTITPDATTRDESRGLPLIYVFAGLVTLPSLVSAIGTAVRDVVCGGVVVENTDEGLAIRCEPSLGVGTVIVRSADEIKVERFNEVRDPSSLLEALNKLRGGA